MNTYAAIQSTRFLWVIQRSDGNYYELDGASASCWSTVQTLRKFSQVNAETIAWALNNPPWPTVTSPATLTYSTVANGSLYQANAVYFSGGAYPYQATKILLAWLYAPPPKPVWSDIRLTDYVPWLSASDVATAAVWMMNNPDA